MDNISFAAPSYKIGKHAAYVYIYFCAIACLVAEPEKIIWGNNFI
jgi:hypothetical protein